MSVSVAEKGYTTTGAVNWAGTQDLDETPELQWPASVRVYDQMRRQEAQVVSVLRAVTLPILRTQWRIDPAGARPSVVQLVAEDLGLPILGKQPKPTPRTRDRFSWSEHLRLALLEIVYGHSYFEQAYRIVNGQARLRKLAWRPPRTIAWIDVADDGGLTALHQYSDLNHPHPDIPVSQLVAYVHDREGANWFGQSVLRAAFRPWILKDQALRTQAVAQDRNGLGVPVYTAAPPPDGLTEDERNAWIKAETEAGLAIASNLRGGENAGVALRPGAQLELMGVTGKVHDTGAQVRYFDEQIAGAVLANFLKLGGSDSTGSYALGETFADFFVMSLQTLAMQIADVATQHVVEDLVDLNFGESEPAPKISFDEIGSKHPATAQAILQLIQCGAVVPDEPLEEFLRTSFGLPSIDHATRRPAAPATPPAGGSPAPDPQTPNPQEQG